ncbi:signal peptide protein [Paenibacillus sp. GSMTC-2017]|nr:hypothetical protein [Paenibacillus sp. GSMTC-2017]MBH5320444.1 signal peptide protein [Paenibacillus sp. GSMTC-2017]
MLDIAMMVLLFVLVLSMWGLAAWSAKETKNDGGKEQ